jgi:hypothetical protein
VAWCAAVAFLTVLGVIAAPLLRRDRRACFFATGMALAAVPVCATFPMDRLLTFPGIGAFGLLAQLLSFLFSNKQAQPANVWRSAIARGMGWTLLVIHAGLAPLLLPLRAANPVGPRSVEQRFYVPRLLAPEVEGQTVIVVNAPSPVHACCLPLLQELNHGPVPRHTRVLAPALPAVAVRRIDERTLMVRPERGYLRWVMDQVFRSDRRPLKLGEKVVLDGMTVEIRELTPDNRPAEARFQFDAALESPSLRWLCYRNHGFEPFTPPAVGESVTIRLDGLLGSH